MVQIYHLSDLHIRAGCNVKARFSEYSFVFNRFIEWLKLQDDLKKSIVVVTGDIFHHKSRIESPGIKLFYDFFKTLATLVPHVIVIRGNHDYKQWDTDDEIDLLGSLLIPKIQGVRYIDQTSVIQLQVGEKQLEIGVLAIQDVLKRGNANASVLNEERTDFPPPSSTNSIKIALFHGSVPNTITAARKFFQGYDVALLGDIHTQQVWGEGKRLAAEASNAQSISQLWVKSIEGFTYGYAGSMIRQGMGEQLKGHGFLQWDMEHGFVKAYHVDNPIELATDEITPMELMETSKKPQVEEEEDQLIEVQEEEENASQWIKYLLQNGGTQDMVPFLNKPEELLLPVISSPSCENSMVDAKHLERQSKIKKKLEAYSDSLGGSDPTTSTKPFRLVLARWDWILCYGAGNVFDFSKLDNKINILSARNGHGKTSFLEVILLGLYGTGFPSRTHKARTASIISLNKPPKVACQVVLTIKVGEEFFRITRQFNRQDDAKKLHTNAKATMVEIRNEESNGWESHLSGKTSVDKWVNVNVGTISNFLLSCMVSQNADNDFFNMTQADQKELLDTAINVESHTRYMELIKESRLAHVAIADLVGATYATLKKSISHLPEISIMNDRIEALNKLIQNQDEQQPLQVAIPSKLEDRSYYEAIVAQDFTSNVDIVSLTHQLAQLKQVQAKALQNVQASSLKPLTYYVAELEKLEEEPADIDPSSPLPTYTEAAFAAAASAYEQASDAMTNDLEDGHGHDIGPFADACPCCEQRKIEYAFRSAAETFSKHICAKRNHLNGCISILKTSMVRDLEATISKAKAMASNITTARAILESYDALTNGRKLTDYMLEHQRLVDGAAQHARVLTEYDAWTMFKTHIDERVNMFNSISKIMEGFIQWMYTDSILPRLSKCTTQVMNLIDPELNLTATIGPDGFEWILKKGANSPPIEKASGFQRFLCGLAVRIALGGIGASGNKPRQLFLDEGFTSCDQENLIKVPDMLHALLRLYDGIVLVTHLEDLKEAGDGTITIERHQEGISKLVF